MPNSPRMFVAFADWAPKQIIAPAPWPTSQARQKWRNNWLKGDFHGNVSLYTYYVNYVVDWSPDLPDSKCLTHLNVALAHNPPPPDDSWGVEGGQGLGAKQPSYSHDRWAHIQQQQPVTALGNRVKMFQWSWYLKAERAQQVVHFQLLHYPLRPMLSTKVLKAMLMGIDSSSQTDCITSNKATLE